MANPKEITLYVRDTVVNSLLDHRNLPRDLAYDMASYNIIVNEILNPWIAGWVLTPEHGDKTNKGKGDLVPNDGNDAKVFGYKLEFACEDHYEQTIAALDRADMTPSQYVTRAIRQEVWT